MIKELLYKNLIINDPLIFEGNISFKLPNSGVKVNIYNGKLKFLEDNYELIYELSIGDLYNISWNPDESYFAITVISQWYEDLYFLDINKKEIIYEITGQREKDGSRAVAFYENTAIIIPTLNYEGGVSDFILFDCETKTSKTIISAELAIHNGLLAEDFTISDDGQFLFIRSNLYSQIDIYSKEDVADSKNLGLAFQNLFNIERVLSTISCINLKSLVDNGSLNILSFSADNLPNTKIVSQKIDNSRYRIFCLCNPVESIIADVSNESEFQDLFIPIKLEGNFDNGYSLSTHTISSTINSDGSFDTHRTELGQLLYEYKYCGNRNSIEMIKQLTIPLLCKLLVELCLGSLRTKNNYVVIPIPPSNIHRPYQPVYELANELFRPFNYFIDTNYLNKKTSQELKSIDDLESRKEILKNAFSVNDKRYKGKSIILFDDLYRSGETLNAAAKILKEQGEVNEIIALTITKTRKKR